MDTEKVREALEKSAEKNVVIYNEEYAGKYYHFKSLHGLSHYYKIREFRKSNSSPYYLSVLYDEVEIQKTEHSYGMRYYKDVTMDGYFVPEICQSKLTNEISKEEYDRISKMVKRRLDSLYKGL